MRILVIGGGPGGYVTAIKAAQRGAEVHLVEKDKLGGTCLNVGCIPTKALLHSALFYEDLSKGTVAGVCAKDISLDWKAVQARKDEIVGKLVAGVGGLLASNKVTVHKGSAVFEKDGTVSVDGKKLQKADATVIATGSVPMALNFSGADLPGVIDSTGALALDEIPASVCIIGGGVIGAEFASIFSAAGAKVTIVELLPEILPPVDSEIAKRLRASFERKGIDILTGAKVVSVKEKNAKEHIVCVDKGGEISEICAQTVLMATGRKANISGLGLESVGIKTEKGAVVVDENFMTSVDGIYAIGDCNARTMLAHAASAQGEAVIDYLFDGIHHYDEKLVPSCVYTKPETASVGMTEDFAKKAGIDYAVGVFDLSANGKASIDGADGGLVKIVADKEMGEILGVHIFGPHATEMIGEATAVMEMEGLTDDLVRTIHPHPTVSEAIGEAAMSVFGDAIHRPPKRR